MGLHRFTHGIDQHLGAALNFNVQWVAHLHLLEHGGAAGFGNEPNLKPAFFALHIGQDLSIGYSSHDAETIELYLEESFTFVTYSDEAVVTLTR